mmetsp:Transcript_11060/g.32805  ORF Transcript_11060/g.32805 Transcript_11060/m.32805 type:complete len:142 (-) Transcript_11060:1144-1569(-)
MAEADSSSIVEKVSLYFYESDEFAESLEKFADDNVHLIDADEIEQSGVMKVEYIDIHRKYQALFEEKIESFISASDSTVQEFYDQLRQKSDADPSCAPAVLGRLMLAVADFDVFMLMMTEVAGKLSTKELAVAVSEAVSES